MKYILLILVSLSLLQCATTPKFQIKKFDSIKLANGLEIYLFKDNQLPYLTLKMALEVGSADDEKGLEGINSFTVSLLEKGTTKRSATEIADDLGQKGLFFSTSSTADYTTISAGGLSEYKSDILSNFSEMILKPAFSSKEVQRQKKQYNAKLSKVLDEPSQLIAVAASQNLFGEHAYGRTATSTFSSIRKVNQKTIQKHYADNYLPNRAKLALVGNFDDAFVESVKAAFSGWKAGSKRVRSFKQPKAIQKMRLTLIEKPGTKQTQIRLNHFGIKRNHPDYKKLKVANLILGGSFGSRLMSEVRTKRGLTYSIYSGFSARLDAGAFGVSTFSRHEKVGETIAATLSTIKEYVEHGMTKEELKSSKAQIIGQFPLIIETPEKLAENVIVLSIFGVGRDYLDNYMKEVDKMTLSEINSIIKKYYHPDKMAITIVSTESKVKKQIKSYDYKKVNFKSVLR